MLITRFTPWQRRADRPHVDRRYRARHVARRADHPARHRQRHVDPDLRVGRVAPAVPGRGRAGAVGHAFKFTVIIVIAMAMILGDRRGRVGAATNTSPVRETCRRPAHVRRPEHLHPAEGQPVGCDPGDLRELVALVPGAPRDGPAVELDGAKNWISDNLVGNGTMSWFYIFVLRGVDPVLRVLLHGDRVQPAQQADIIRKQGGFIPGIRPGPPDRALPRQGAQPHHAARRAVPGVHRDRCRCSCSSVWDIQQFPFGGTSILITVGVMLETMKQLDSQLMMRNYEGFLS